MSEQPAATEAKAMTVSIDEMIEKVIDDYYWENGKFDINDRASLVKKAIEAGQSSMQKLIDELNHVILEQKHDLSIMGDQLAAANERIEGLEKKVKVLENVDELTQQMAQSIKQEIRYGNKETIAGNACFLFPYEL